MSKPRPPKFISRFFRWFCDPEIHSFIEGDLLELYQENVENFGKKKADRSFAKDVVLLFRPGIIRKRRFLKRINLMGMIKHNFTISIRSFKHHPISFGINLLGLTTSLASVLLIGLWIFDELSVDQFHKKNERLFHILENVHYPTGVETQNETADPLAMALISEVPEVENAVAVNYFTDDFSGKGVVSFADKNIKAKGVFATDAFFQVFSYDLVRGSKDHVLADKNAVVLSQDLADKLFTSNETVIGQTINFEHNVPFDGPFHVSGIFENPPSNATQQFDIVFNFEKIQEADRFAGKWNSRLAQTYVVLQENSDIDQFNAKVTELFRSKNKRARERGNTLVAQQYSREYLYGQYESGKETEGRIAYVRLFAIIAFFLLLIACINFMNLSTARANRKLKEIGVKKVVGASRKDLAIQFLCESTILVIFAVALSLLLAFVLLPQFRLITGKDLHLGFANTKIILAVPLLALITGLISGSYPAFYLSSFQSIKALKGNIHTTIKALFARRILVVFQFVIGLVLIVGVFVVREQLLFLQQKNLGYDRQHVISFEREGRFEKDPSLFLTKLREVPGVVEAGGMAASILDGSDSDGPYSWPGLEDEKGRKIEAPRLNYDAIEALGLEILEGRSFSEERKDDDLKIVLNESAVDMMKLEEPIGQLINHGSRQMEIIGVVKDFHYGSLHRKIEPMVLRFRNANTATNVLVRLQEGTEQRTISEIKALYEAFHPKFTFNYSFLDEDYQALYESESKVAILSRYFSLIALIVSCLGLFGLVSYTAEQKRKEIGIRKVLGSSVLGIVNLLSWEFAKPVFIAILISIPISFLLATRWLTNFAYNIDLDWYVFLWPSLAVLIIAWTVVGLQAMKAARLNPIHVLNRD